MTQLPVRRLEQAPIRPGNQYLASNTVQPSRRRAPLWRLEAFAHSTGMLDCSTPRKGLERIPASFLQWPQSPELLDPPPDLLAYPR